MSEHEPARDETIARALQGIRVPDHGPTFWGDLDRAIADSATSATPAASATPAHRRLDTGELPAVTSLTAEREARRPRRASLVAAAAGLVVLAGAVGVVLLAGDGDGRSGDLADSPVDISTSTPNAETAPSPLEATSGDASATTVAAVAAAGTADPARTVESWLEALGRGDVAAAADLLGPRTLAYLGSLGPDVTPEGFMRESEEGYGAWMASPDRELGVLDLGSLDLLGAKLAIVTVSGTWTGEGETEQRIDAIPVVDDGDGWRIEHLAYDATRDTNILVFTVPVPSSTGLVMKPEEDFNVFVPATGTVFFQLDGGDLYIDATSMVGRDPEPFALYNPPGDLVLGAHRLVVVAVGEDGTIAAFGGIVSVQP